MVWWQQHFWSMFSEFSVQCQRACTTQKSALMRPSQEVWGWTGFLVVDQLLHLQCNCIPVKCRDHVIFVSLFDLQWMWLVNYSQLGSFRGITVSIPDIREGGLCDDFHVGLNQEVLVACISTAWTKQPGAVTGTVMTCILLSIRHKGGIIKHSFGVWCAYSDWEQNVEKCKFSFGSWS